MKPKFARLHNRRTRRSRTMLAARTFGFSIPLAFALYNVQAADVVKLSSGALNTATSWDGGALPGSGNTALFNSTSVTSGAGATFNASGAASILTWGAMKVTDIAGPLNFTNVATVTVGALGGTIIDLSTAPADVTFDSGTLRLSTAAGGSINVASGRTLTVNNLTNNSGTKTYTFNGGGNIVVNGGNFLSGGAASAIINNANLTLNGGGTGLLSGSVTLQSGLLNFGNDSALGTKEITATGGTITASGGARTIGNGFTLSNTVTFGGSNDLTITSAISGSGTLAKGGTATLTLDGANTYTGETVISGGTLALGAAGLIDNTSGVSLVSGGIFDVSATGGYTLNNLSGSGDVLGALTVSTELAIGNSTGTVNFSSDLTLGSSATYTYELTGATASANLGNVSGDLTISAGTILDLVQLGTYTGGDKFTLFAYDGILSGNFDGHADDSTFIAAGGSWLINYDDSSAGFNGGISANDTYVTITAVPEPAASLLGGLGTMLLLRRRRSR